jgi:hypothetical protein
MRDFCGPLSADMRHFDQGSNRQTCRPCVHWGRKLQRYSVFIFAFVLTLVLSIEVRADKQPVEGNVVVLAPDITNWSPELKGGLWGWHLTKYGCLEWIFRIDGKTLIMLSTDINATDNVLWDPLTGAGLHLNHEEYEEFNQTHKDDQYLGVPELYTDRLFPLGEKRMIQTQISPPYIANVCTMLFSYYFNIFNMDHDLVGSFYVLVKLPYPITTMRDTCAEGDSGPSPYPADFRYNTQIPTYYTALGDGSILFIIFDGVSTRIIRLDRELRQHSTVDGHMFILDAAPINAELDASPRSKDSRFRYEVLLKKIEELKASGR